MTFTRAFHTIALLAAMLGTFGCAKKSGDEPRKILADISVLQTKEEALIAEMATRENIFIADRLEGFPENRDELKPVAQQQIESLNGIIELEDRQIAKLESISSVTADKDFLQYAELNQQIWKKRRDDKQLGIRKFKLISDPKVNSRAALVKSIEEIKSHSEQIDEEIKQLELQKTELRKRIGT
jgi:hypothetical protein